MLDTTTNGQAVRLTDLEKFTEATRPQDLNILPVRDTVRDKPLSQISSVNMENLQQKPGAGHGAGI